MAVGNYASNTTVTPEKSQADIRNTLRKYGADKFGVMEESDKAHVMFEYQNLRIQMTMPLPQRSEFMKTEQGRSRPVSAVDASHDKAIRQRWRALLLAIKAKLEAVECGVSSLESEFMAFVIMPDGLPLHEHIIPRLRELAETGKMPKLLGGSL